MSGADARLHVADPNIVASMILGDASNAACATLGVDAAKVRGYVKNHPDMCWAQHIAKGRAVYVPVNYPYHTHWSGVLMWRNGSQHFVRVYNSMKTLVSNDMKIAKVVCEVVRAMDAESNEVEFQLHANDNHIEQREKTNRCALHVITRCWQASRGEHLTHDIQLKDVDAATEYLKVALLQQEVELCSDKAVPVHTL